MTPKSLDILSNAPVGSTVEVEGRRIRVDASGSCVGCFFAPHCGPLVAPRCLSRNRPDGQNVRYFDVTDQPTPNPWQGWPDARRDGMCEIPVVVARNIKTLLDEVTPKQWIAAGLTGNNQIETGIFLDNALNGKVE